jgi:hypothetical protein
MKTTKQLKKTLKRVNNFLKKHNKALQKFIKNILKTLQTYRNDMKKITFLLAVTIMAAACGSTKVLVDKPATGTQTTITVTTNNPISTNIDADASANLK